MKRRSFHWGVWGGALFILPGFLVLMLVVVVPIFVSFFFSFTDYSVLTPPRFVAFANYAELWTSRPFRAALLHTVIYTLISVPLQTVLSLLVADLLARRFCNVFGTIVRSSLFIPVISSAALAGVVWRFLLDTDFGLINRFIETFGIPGPNWFGEPTLALVAVALVTVWKNVGYFLVIYYAGILQIPRELYEAADMDGATHTQKLFHVTIPQLRPVTLLVVVLGTIWSFQVFDLVYTMTGGGPGGATTTLVMAVYKAGFRDFRMGYASAIAMVLFAVILAVSLVQLRYFQDRKSA